MNLIQKHLNKNLYIKFSDLDQETIDYIKNSDLIWQTGDKLTGQISPESPFLCVEFNKPSEVYYIYHCGKVFASDKRKSTLAEFQEAIGMKKSNLVNFTPEILKSLDKTKTYKVYADDVECLLNYSEDKIQRKLWWFLHSDLFQGYDAKVKLKKFTYNLLHFSSDTTYIPNLISDYSLKSLTIDLNPVETKDKYEGQLVVVFPQVYNKSDFYVDLASVLNHYRQKTDYDIFMN